MDGVQAALTCGVPSARVRDAISRGRVVFAVKANRNDYAEMQETVSFGPGPGATITERVAQNPIAKGFLKLSCRAASKNIHPLTTIRICR